MFGNWELNNYVGCLSTVSANYCLRNTKVKSIHSKKNIDKSSLISKYNYRYYNLKFINLLSKKLQIDIRNFHTLSLLVAHSVFINKDNLDYTIRKLKSIGLDSTEFKKIVKLSILFLTYNKQFTKKMQNVIDNKFSKI